MFSHFQFKFQVIRINTCISILKDSNIPILATDAHNVEEIEGTKGQDAQSHSVSSPSKAMSILDLIIEENAIKVDSTLDQLLNIGIEQNTPAIEEQVGIKVPVYISAPIPVIETNKPILEQSM